MTHSAGLGSASTVCSRTIRLIRCSMQFGGTVMRTVRSRAMNCSHVVLTLSLVVYVWCACCATEAIGSGVTCEPGSLFPPCQNHLHAALRLHSALRGKPMSNQTRAWVEWAYVNQNIMWEANAPTILTHNSLFKILRLQPFRESLHRGFDLPGKRFNYKV